MQLDRSNFFAENLYPENLSLDDLHKELGSVTYHLEVMKTSIDMLNQARTELIKKIEAIHNEEKPEN